MDESRVAKTFFESTLQVEETWEGPDRDVWILMRMIYDS
jgi:hypothetical protein